nr:hypothetical protein [Gluconobacter morbifer]
MVSQNSAIDFHENSDDFPAMPGNGFCGTVDRDTQAPALHNTRHTERNENPLCLIHVLNLKSLFFTPVNQRGTDTGTRRIDRIFLHDFRYFRKFGRFRDDNPVNPQRDRMRYSGDKLLTDGNKTGFARPVKMLLVSEQTGKLVFADTQNDLPEEILLVLEMIVQCPLGDSSVLCDP